MAASRRLHPKVHGGILHPPREPLAHRPVGRARHPGPLNMVVVNLYAFEKTAAKTGRCI